MEKRKMTIFGVLLLLIVFALGVCVVIFSVRNIGGFVELVAEIVAQSVGGGTGSLPEVNMITAALVVIYGSMFFYIIFAYIGAWIGVGSRKQGGYLTSLIFGVFILLAALEIAFLLFMSEYLVELVNNVLEGTELQITFYIDLEGIKFESMFIIPLAIGQFVFSIIAYIRQVSLNKKAKKINFN